MSTAFTSSTTLTKSPYNFLDFNLKETKPGSLLDMEREAGRSIRGNPTAQIHTAVLTVKPVIIFIENHMIPPQVQLGEKFLCFSQKQIG